MKTSNHLWNASRAYRRRREAEAARRRAEKRRAADAAAARKVASAPERKPDTSHGRFSEEAAERAAAQALAWRCDGCGRTFRPRSCGSGLRLVGRDRDGGLTSDRLRLGGHSYCAACAAARSKPRKRFHGLAPAPAPAPLPLPAGWRMIG